MKTVVIGHVEWAEFVQVERVPDPGDIVHATDSREQAAGGAAVAAVQISRLGGGCLFMTAIGGDTRGDLVVPALDAMGLRVMAARRKSAQRRAFVYLDAGGERTITTIGERVYPEVGDRLPWNELDDTDAVYFTAGNAETLKAARAAKMIVASVRAGESLSDSGVQIDVLVASMNDKGEQYERGDIEPEPHWVVRTDGSRGGTLESSGGKVIHWDSVKPEGPKGDTYGAGDSFAGGITCGLAMGLPVEDAIKVGAFCGSSATRGTGPYAGQASNAEFKEWLAAQAFGP